MSERNAKPLTFRERLALRLLLLSTQLVAGKCFDGGLDSDFEDKVKSLQAEIMLEPIVLKRERAKESQDRA